MLSAPILNYVRLINSVNTNSPYPFTLKRTENQSLASQDRWPRWPLSSFPAVPQWAGTCPAPPGALLWVLLLPQATLGAPQSGASPPPPSTGALQILMWYRMSPTAAYENRGKRRHIKGKTFFFLNVKICYYKEVGRIFFKCQYFLNIPMTNKIPSKTPLQSDPWPTTPVTLFLDKDLDDILCWIPLNLQLLV